MANSTDKQSKNKGNKRGLHPNSLKNLENGRAKWKKGQSGNPLGRPQKGDSITEALREELKRVPTTETDELDGKGQTFAQIIAHRTVQLAARGDDRARNTVLERTEGKVTQLIGGDSTGRPIILRVVYDGDKH